MDSQNKYPVFFEGGKINGMGESLALSEKSVSFQTKTQLKEGATLDMRIIPPNATLTIAAKAVVTSVIPGQNNLYDVCAEFAGGEKDFKELVSDKDRLAFTHSMRIESSQRNCYDAICNFESYPRWQKVVNSVKVLRRGVDMRPVDVEYVFDFILKKVKLVSQYEYNDTDFILRWKTIDGDVKWQTGSYVFEKIKEDSTNAVLTLDLVLGYPVPRRVIDYLSKVAMRRSIKSLKDVVESGMPKKRP